nr:PREDICTED: protein D3-like isoform X2 [Bemisia tabaci]
MYLYDSSLIFGLWTLVSCVSVPPTTEQDALLVSTPLPNLQDSLRKHLIIPDLLRIGPDYVLNMMYGNKSVTVGNEFTLEDLGLEPTSIHYTCREDAFHTLIVVGLDVPTQKNHTEREWVHWIQVNIPAYNITSGETVVPYQGPGSSYGYGHHRMVFLVYEQPWRHTISFSEKAFASSPVRPKFNTERFAEKYDIGNPIAANFLICYTDSPPPTKLAV